MDNYASITTFVLQSNKYDIHPHVADIQQLNQELATLKDMSPVAAEVLQRPVEDINHRWTSLLKGIADREVLEHIDFHLRDIDFHHVSECVCFIFFTN